MQLESLSLTTDSLLECTRYTAAATWQSKLASTSMLASDHLIFGGNDTSMILKMKLAQRNISIQSERRFYLPSSCFQKLF